MQTRPKMLMNLDAGTYHRIRDLIKSPRFRFSAVNI
jgi:hypothetical protein